MMELAEREKKVIRDYTDDFDKKFGDRKKLFLRLGYDDSEAEELSWYSFCCNDAYSTFELFCIATNKFKII